MNNPKEDDQYKLFIDSFNYIVLSVSFVESNVVWLSSVGSSYKYDRKKGRLYKWVGDGYDGVDMQYGFTRLSSDDVWESRKQPSNANCDYSGFYGD